MMFVTAGTKTYRRTTEIGTFPAFLRNGRRIGYLDGPVVKIVDTTNVRISEILKGDSRRSIEVFALAPDHSNLYVSWASTQADLWLMDLAGRK
jgi:Tol biopolymer transport system component